MSDDEKLGHDSNKRKAESDDEDQEPRKRGRTSPQPEEVSSQRGGNNDRRSIEEAIKALDKFQYEVNMGNLLADSPESSDHDTPPESEDDSGDDGMHNQAHALGFAACVRETFRFLDSCGISKSDPIYKQLKSRFIGISN